MEFLLYTAGSIGGLSYRQATSWTHELGRLLRPEVKILSPMRYKEVLKDEDIIKGSYEDQPERGDELMLNRRAIVARDKFDVRRCDMLVANLELSPRIASLGTVSEITIAHEHNKPVVLILDITKDNVHNHPFVTEPAGWIVKNIQEAAHVINSVLCL